jgi:hypothetical protein
MPRLITLLLLPLLLLPLLLHGRCRDRCVTGECAQPGSHKSNLRHPFQENDNGHPQVLWRSEQPQQRRHGKEVKEGGYMDGVPGALELTTKAGDAVLLVESCMHGSTIRQLPGARRYIVIRYGPATGDTFAAPPELFARLGPRARALIAPEPAAPAETSKL